MYLGQSLYDIQHGTEAKCEGQLLPVQTKDWWCCHLLLCSEGGEGVYIFCVSVLVDDHANPSVGMRLV